MSTFDIIIITIILLIIVVLFTINISSVIDNKLSNVEINLPPINIPDPQITVKIQKTYGSENYDVYIDKPNSTINQNTVSLSPIDTKEHFEQNMETIPIKNIKLQKQESLSEEKISAENKISDVNNAVKSEESIKLIGKESEKIISKESQEKQIHFSDEEDYRCSNDKDSVTLTCKQLENGEFRCFKNININDSMKKTNDINNDEILVHSNTRQNKSLVDQKNEAYKYLIKNNISTDSFPICNSSTYHDIINGDNDCDPSDYHRQYQYYVKSYLEDPVVRGYNINEYDHNASLDQIGKIKLSKDYNNPKPSGYIF